jgi:SMC interacting uncharacterized protein involved in chromosome segregation
MNATQKKTIIEVIKKLERLQSRYQDIFDEMRREVEDQKPELEHIIEEIEAEIEDLDEDSKVREKLDQEMDHINNAIGELESVLDFDGEVILDDLIDGLNKILE